MEFHGVKTTYRGINATDVLIFCFEDYSLSLKQLTESKFNFYLLVKQTHYTTNCEDVSR